MKSGDLMYDIPTPIIAIVLLLAMLLAMWLGYRAGTGRQSRETEQTRSQTTAVQGSLLGLLALLLGFTFSLALARHDARSASVVSEANAIGTAWLRTDFLPAQDQVAAKADLRRYLRLRVEAGEVSADKVQRRARLTQNAEAAFDKVWALASARVQDPGGPANVSFATSLNDMIDALASRNAALDRHVPEIVLYMLFVTFVLSGAMLGFSSGTNGSKPATPVYLMLTLIVLLVFLIVDLDRPRRGIIEVDQSAMRALLNTVKLPNGS
ncbi:hypothetical protein SAMN04488523_104181 [Sulfitobacter brevis]|uniref:DUF4239 domain-containing protein n=1 Tax=Sulfitobacter brevis TaxID=74348 RepID=A0A1I1X3T0_9RHOB|nr:hypothetical protein [Sulfitobacter brevis]SFD99990.1 hypothetical protein SAMN04488523_104181 [Sulfitobacter brevis]